MTRKQEILINYREITITLERLDMELDKLSRYGFIGGPRPVHSPQLTGMPRGTNDPEAAMIQRNDIEDEIIDNIRAKQAVQYEMMMEARRIVDAIEDPRLQNIVAYYYLHGWTDERIAELYDREDEGKTLSRQTVQKVRSDYFNSLA